MALIAKLKGLHFLGKVQRTSKVRCTLWLSSYLEGNKNRPLRGLWASFQVPVDWTLDNSALWGEESSETRFFIPLGGTDRLFEALLGEVSLDLGKKRVSISLPVR